MAILVECPICYKKWSTECELCSCGKDLVKAKRAKRVKYWIAYRLPGGKQRREVVGYSIQEARDAEGKRRSQKREKRIFDIKPEVTTIFQEITDWYLGLESVKATAYYVTQQTNLKAFNSCFGNTLINQIKPADLENYQAKRKKAGRADSYVDQEIGAAKRVIKKAFYNDKVDADTLKTFQRVEKLLKRNANARNKILTLDQFKQLMNHLPQHTRAILATGFYTGMRRGEILCLTQNKVDLKGRVIQLEAEDTKDNEPRYIPICDELYEILRAQPTRLQANYVFQYKGKPLKDIRTALRSACRKTGIPFGRKIKGGFVYHDLRHSFNTHMRKSGVPESVIMKITGHSTREMFDRYNTVDAEDARQAINKMQNYFANVDQSVDQNAKSAKNQPTRIGVKG